ncbi:MAG: SGNH/GDSL hydrolase family protein [Gordonia sp. (in: high G+C Gram-positive bacteria)]
MSRAFLGRAATALVTLGVAAAIVLPGSSTSVSEAQPATQNVRPVVQTETEEPPTTPKKYVALGSSYASGPEGADSLRTRCLRSADNYPQQVAAAMGFSLIDATCSGSTTANILDTPQRFTRSPQIDAVTADTAVVTITTGGNDIGYIQRLISMSCRNVAPPVARQVAARACNLGRPIPPVPDAVALGDLEAKMLATVYAVREHAPKARIILVDYPPAVVAGEHPCARLPLTTAEIATAVQTFDALTAVSKRVADATGIELVQASTAGADHTVCSRDPWLLGFELGVPYHPDAAGKRGVARLVTKVLRTPAPPIQTPAPLPAPPVYVAPVPMYDPNMGIYGYYGYGY